MDYTQIALGFIISLVASIAGAISGIGGGVIIKPLMDIVEFADTATISFLSAMTVLSMAVVTLSTSLASKGKTKINFRISAFLAVGSVIGGILGKYIFNEMLLGTVNERSVSTTQSIILLAMIVVVLIYMLNKKRIRTHTIDNVGVCIAVGFGLGAISSFLGIGGGPLNIILLFFLFSMNAKTAALNSIFIILFSQISSLIYLVADNAVPVFEWPMLILMIIGGIAGAFIGRAFSKKMNYSMVEKLYIAVMVFVAAMCMVDIMGY